jgi:hypothetical protein
MRVISFGQKLLCKIDNPKPSKKSISSIDCLRYFIAAKKELGEVPELKRRLKLEFSMRNGLSL